jgi:hypothetical protein
MFPINTILAWNINIIMNKKYDNNNFIIASRAYFLHACQPPVLALQGEHREPRPPVTSVPICRTCVVWCGSTPMIFHPGASGHEHDPGVVAAGGGWAFEAGFKKSQLTHNAHYAFPVARAKCPGVPPCGITDD